MLDVILLFAMLGIVGVGGYKSVMRELDDAE
jgi:hypothetical protein